MRNLIMGVALFVFAQCLIWIQTNGQFVWPWFKKNPLLVSLMGGTIISYIFIKGNYAFRLGLATNSIKAIVKLELGVLGKHPFKILAQFFFCVRRLASLDMQYRK